MRKITVQYVDGNNSVQKKIMMIQTRLIEVKEEDYESRFSKYEDIGIDLLSSFQFKKGVAMRKRASYHTKQKEKILSMIKKQKKEFTVKQLYNSLNNEIGLTTIYRLIDKLVYNGRQTNI